jgi:flagellar L-ring protein precursor FlgH
MSVRHTGIVVIVASLLGACATAPPIEPPEDWGPAEPSAAFAEPTHGALYGTSSLDLFADLRARRVGDVLTILLDERTTGTNQSATSTGKGSSVETSMPLFGGGPVTNNGDEIFSNEFSSEQSFEGQADSSQSNRLDGSITVTVAEALPNGNLLVRGEKWITINQSKEFIRFSGIVRPIDVGPNNTVSSTKVADAQVSYSGQGPLAASNSPGWLTRFFNSPWFPF